jgi:hypothetical protein
MAKTKVKQDSHGVYVCTNASIYRPWKTPHSPTIKHAVNSIEDGETKFSTGDLVNVRNKTQTPLCVVKAGGIEEYWHSHGCYYKDGKPIDSSLCYTPDKGDK